MKLPKPITPRGDQISVWSFPRPAVAKSCTSHLQIVLEGVVLAETRRGYMVLETSHPPTYYFPQTDIKMQYLKLAERNGSVCEWKGSCDYWDVQVGNKLLRRVGFSYPNPTPSFVPMKDYIAFYARDMDACYVDGERVVPQEGSFYAGWITSKYSGPFKGSTGSMFW